MAGRGSWWPHHDSGNSCPTVDLALRSELAWTVSSGEPQTGTSLPPEFSPLSPDDPPYAEVYLDTRKRWHWEVVAGGAVLALSALPRSTSDQAEDDLRTLFGADFDIRTDHRKPEE